MWHVQEALCNAVLEAFVDYLIEEKEIDLVAIYVATVPHTRQIDLYARLLKGSLIRFMYISLSFSTQFV